MQQYTYLKSLLRLPKLPSIRTQKTGKIQNADILMVSLTVLAVLNSFDIWHPLTLFLFGLLLPFICIRFGIQINSQYFIVLSVLFWMRVWHNVFRAFDGILIVCLWHPNIKWAERLVGYIKKIIQPKTGNIFERINKKVDRFLQ